jgi:hypothetical protein
MKHKDVFTAEGAEIAEENQESSTDSRGVEIDRS